MDPFYIGIVLIFPCTVLLCMNSDARYFISIVNLIRSLAYIFKYIFIRPVLICLNLKLYMLHTPLFYFVILPFFSFFLFFRSNLKNVIICEFI